MRSIAFGALTQIARNQSSVRLGGRVLQGPIQLGDEFTLLRIESDEADRPIRLVVTGINLYGHDMVEVDSPMTPYLTLEGSEITELECGAVLTGWGLD